MSKAIALAASLTVLLCTSVQAAQPNDAPGRPWLDPSLSPEARAHAARRGDDAR